MAFDPILNLENLDGSNGFVIEGIDASDFSGSSISNAGDINNDGIDDLIIGASGAGDNSTGESYVVFGRQNFNSGNLKLADLNGSNGFVINGIDSLDLSGFSVSNAGDINGDGIDDLAIGAPYANFQTDAPGEAYVVFGGETVGASGSLNLAALEGSNGFVINGIDALDGAGGSVSNAGDINNDGIDDLLIGGADAADPNGNDLAGETYVVFGGTSVGASGSFNLSELDGSNGFVLNGIDSGDQSSRSVSNAGDVNDDGIDDLLIGAFRGDPNGRNDAGETYVVFGNSAVGASGSLNLSELNGSNGFVINGVDSGDLSGRSISNAGDINGDGIDDVLIGAYGADPNGTNFAGETYVVFGGSTVGASGSFNLSELNGSNGFVINGIEPGEASGEAVSNAGDINGDGADDLLIGALRADGNGNSTGKTYVVFGGNTVGSSGNLNLTDLNINSGFVINGIDSSDFLGRAVSNGGDINDDGIEDFIVSASSADVDGNIGTGETYVIFGELVDAPRLVTVDTLVDEDDGDLSPGDVSLREALARVDEGGTVAFAPGLQGTINLNPSLGELVIDKSLNLIGDTDGDNVADITVDAQGNSRVFRVDDDDFRTLSQVSIDSLILAGGAATASSGGGILNFEALEVANSTVSGNTASMGGGIHVGYSTYSPYNAVYFYTGSLTLSNSVVANNEGGGVSTDFGGGEITAVNSTISGNVGDGIRVLSTNSSGAYGSFSPGILTVTSSTLSGNQGGWGIYSGSSSETTVLNSTISGNDSGGIYTGYQGTTSITNATIADNDGSGVEVGFQGSTNLTNSLVANNALDTYGVGTSGVNLIGDSSLTGSNIINADPNLGELADNGGPTLTHALLAGSPAIDAGDSAFAPSDDFDQRGSGFLRVVDGDGDGIAQIDLGAFEAAEPIFNTVIVDTLVDEIDGDLSAGDVSLREALAFVETGGTIEFAPDLAGTIALDASLGQLVIDKALTINGTGEDVITVDAQGNSRVFRISDEDYGTQLGVNIQGLTITGGNVGDRFDNDGGGIYTTEELDLTNVTITGNTAFDGGGISGQYGSITLTDSTVSGNEAAGSGGGIHNQFTETTLIRSTVSDNTATTGGGIADGIGGSSTLISSTVSGNSAVTGGGISNDENYSNGVSLSDTVVANNTASGLGGGISIGNYNGGMNTIANSIISSNTSGLGGGGIYIAYRSGEVFLNNTIVDNNATDGDGGGVGTGSQASFSAVDSKFTNNSAGNDGGGIDAYFADISRSTISGNVAASDGGGIYSSSRRGGLNLEDSTVSDNTAGASGGGILVEALYGFTVTNSTISGNGAENGGGVYKRNDYYGNFYSSTIQGSLIANNSVTGFGGGLANNYGSINLIDSAVTGNEAAGAGGGIYNYSNAEATLTGTLVSGNTAGSGGGIANGFASGSTLIDSTVFGNSAFNGGGISDGDYSDGSSLSNTVVSGNTATGSGGGIIIGSYSNGTSITNSSVISDNTAGQGGGMSVGYRSGGVAVTDSTVSENTAEGNGGGIQSDMQASISVTDSEVVNNIAGNNGGGIEGYLTTVTRSTISGNVASGQGGGIYNSGYFGQLDLTDSTIADNTANDKGGGIATDSAGTTINSSIISGNTVSGSNAGGGGIYSLSSTFKVENSTVSGNKSDGYGVNGEGFGGGILARDTALTVSNSTIVDNRALGLYAYGGGIFNDSSHSTVINSAIDENRSIGTTYRDSGGYGGGIQSVNSYLSIDDSTVNGNSSNGSGGGIYSIRGDLVIRNGSVNNNATTSQGDDVSGGGIVALGDLLLIDFTTVSNNAASSFSDRGRSSGGGIISGSDRFTLTNSTVSGNDAFSAASLSFGGGLTTSGQSTIVSNSTISGNRSNSGGGLSNYHGLLQIRNSTIAQNITDGDSGSVSTSSPTEVLSSIIAGNVGGDVSSNLQTFLSQGNNLIGTGNSVDAFNQSTDITGVTDPGLEPLADNGGPTQTQALRPDSQAIDAGSNPDGLASDQRGEGFTRVVVAQTDIGAFELQTLLPDDNTFFFSGTKDKALGDLAIENEDIVFFDGEDFSLFFDGSDVLPTNLEIRAFDVTSDTTILLSFDQEVTLAGVGLVDDTDIVEFTATSLGAGTTSGTFSLYLDGSDIGLNSASEDIDALTRLSDDSLLLSTTGNVALPGGVFGQDEDLIRFEPTSLGSNTSGTASLYFDGSDVDLRNNGEDLNAIAVRQGELFFSTNANLSVPGLRGNDEDIASFTPSSIGETTAGSFGEDLFFDGNTFGFTGNVTGFDFGVG
ncbi:MAG: choice-of-anchor Q domain-containing protein [Leptolyngbyaceae cyanobacterium]